MATTMRGKWFFGLVLGVTVGVASAQSVTVSPDDPSVSCEAIDETIVALLPVTRATRPGFYEDPLVGVGAWFGTVTGAGFYVLPAYAEVRRLIERRDIGAARQHLAVLRRAKARKRCFEFY